MVRKLKISSLHKMNCTKRLHHKGNTLSVSIFSINNRRKIADDLRKIQGGFAGIGSVKDFRVPLTAFVQGFHYRNSWSRAAGFA